MEEGNIVEHKNYLSVEEEKRKRAHAVRATISGPLLRWVSRHETVTVPAETQCPPGMLELPALQEFLNTYFRRWWRRREQLHKPGVGEPKYNIRCPTSK
jgi:vacuolar protein sorting-associated protein 72